MKGIFGRMVIVQSDFTEDFVITQTKEDGMDYVLKINKNKDMFILGSEEKTD